MGACAIANPEDRPQGPQGDDLVLRAQSGDFAAFEDLYRDHVDRVYAICRRMTADPDRAEELTQQAFVRAWEKLDSFRGGYFLAWLRKLTVNVVLSDRRARRRRDDKEHPVGDLLEFTSPSRPTASGTHLDLEQAIASLPANARRVFILHDVEGYRHREIAGMLRVAPGTSKSQLHRARKMLREALRS